jgi:hypothetical protein
MAIERKVTRAVKTGNIEKVRKILDEFGTHQPTLNNNANEILVGNTHMRAHFTQSDIALYKTLPIGVSIIKGYDDIVALLVNFVMQHAAQTHMNWIQQIHMPIYSDMALTYKRMEVIKLLFRPEFGISVSGVAGAIKPILQHAELLLTQAHQKHKDESAYREIVEFLKNPHHRTESISQNITPSIPTSTTQANPTHIHEEEEELVAQEIPQTTPTQALVATHVAVSISSPTSTAYDDAAQSLEQKIKELETNMLQRLTIKILFSLASSDYKIKKLEEYILALAPHQTPVIPDHVSMNDYQQAFYKALQWELTGCYLSALLIHREVIPSNKTGILGECGKLVKVGGSFVPMAGSIVKLIGSIMIYADQEQQKKVFER